MSFIVKILLATLLQISYVSADEVYVVSPPFLNERKFLVSQGFNGEKTHRDLLNRYAVDLAMPEKEPVCAVDYGTVESLNNVSPMSEWFNKVTRTVESGYVRIKHDNGLVSDYQHLLPGSITVRVGQPVALGECFAKVGSSGFSTGPHLHFAILQELDGEYLSKPFQFIDPDDVSYTPKYLGWVYN